LSCPLDAGAAWLAPTLQARKLIIHAHAMTGFNLSKAHDILQVPSNAYDIMAVIAVG
jgi:hypothetical protein